MRDFFQKSRYFLFLCVFQITRSQIFQPVSVGQQDVVGFWQGDAVVGAEAGEDAADGFDGEAEIVGDFAAGHWQMDFGLAVVARVAGIGAGEQEAGDAFARGFAAEQQHLFLGGDEFVAGGLQQLGFEGWEIVHQGVEFGAGKAAEADRFDRLGGEGVGFGDGEAEKMARAGEAGDLQPTVRQELVELGGAGGDVEEIGRVVAFLDENLAFFDGAMDGDGGELREPGFRDGVAHAVGPRITLHAGGIAHDIGDNERSDLVVRHAPLPPENDL